MQLKTKKKELDTNKKSFESANKGTNTNPIGSHATIILQSNWVENEMAHQREVFFGVHDLAGTGLGGDGGHDAAGRRLARHRRLADDRRSRTGRTERETCHSTLKFHGNLHIFMTLEYSSH